MATNYSKYIDSKSTHYIANSGGDEKGGTTGGKAGDQTGKEWQLKKWYSRPWACVLRYPNKKVRDMIAQYGIDAALNDHIGYNQAKRYTYWDELVKAGYNPAKVTKDCDEDCTAGVTANVRAVGYTLGIKALQDIPKTVRSSNMRKYFKKAGFEVLTDKKYLNGYSYLLPGDILLYDNHHAATNITKGKNAVEPSDKSDVPTSDPKPTVSEGTKQYVKVSHGNYYVRETPDKKGKEIAVVGNGVKLDYLGENQNGWWKVLYKGKTGWISSKCGSIITESVDYIIIGDGTWYVRAMGNANGKKLGTVKSGDKLIKKGEPVNGWQKVDYNGDDGWVSVKDIKS